MELQDVTRINFGFEFWTPARIAEPRMVLGYECTLRGKLFALRSEVFSPGPFDELGDITSITTDRLAALMRDVHEATPDT